MKLSETQKEQLGGRTRAASEGFMGTLQDITAKESRVIKIKGLGI